jgi:hypothetical protein
VGLTVLKRHFTFDAEYPVAVPCVPLCSPWW